MLIIGGGGDTDTFLGHGGGSGFVTFEQVSVSAPATLLVTVGRGGANGYPAGDGGYDGGDGEHSPFSSEGGQGSGVNVTEITMINFSLSPGAGGVGVGFYGGGGGGVIVKDAEGGVHGVEEHEKGDGVGYGAGGTLS